MKITNIYIYIYKEFKILCGFKIAKKHYMHIKKIFYIYLLQNKIRNSGLDFISKITYIYIHTHTYAYIYFDELLLQYVKCVK